MYAHVLGMDALALGLGNAAALKQSVLPPSLPPVHVSGIDAFTHSPRSTAIPTCSPGSLPSVPHCKPHRRESVDVEDIVYAHMLGMNALASGLRNAGCPIHSLLSFPLLACVRSPPPTGVRVWALKILCMPTCWAWMPWPVACVMQLP